MEPIELVNSLVKVRTLRRLITELNKVIPQIKKDDDKEKVKETVNILNEVTSKYIQNTTFECPHCHSQVVYGKCTGCKTKFISGRRLKVLTEI